MTLSTENLIINSIIGEGTKLRGEFELNGLLRIDGEFIGKIEQGGRVLVGATGSATANERVGEHEAFISSEIIIVGGKVLGNLQAHRRVVLLETAEVVGNIETPRLVMEEGAVISGQCKVVKPEGMEEDKISDKKAINLAKKEVQKTVV